MCCLAFDLAPLAGDRHRALPDAGAVIASWQASPIEKTKTRTHCPSSRAARPADGRSRLHACNRCLPATRRADHATASPTGCRCAASRSTWHHWPADRHRALPDAGAVIALWQASPIEKTKTRTHCPSSRAARPADGRSRLHACNRCLPATRRADHATASPTGCRCAASRSTWHHWPADRHRALPDAGAVIALWQASPIERTKPRTNCPTNCTPLTTATPVCRRASNARL
jgi:hypothetical protein